MRIGISIAVGVGQRPPAPPEPGDDDLGNEDGDGRILAESGDAIPLEAPTP